MIILSSNFEFTFSGSVTDEESINILARLIVKGIRPWGWRYEKGGLFFNMHQRDTDNLIETSDNNEEYITSIIKLYLNSSVYKQALEKVSYINGDGSCHNGWIATFVYESADFKGVYITPFRCFYHK